MKIISMANKNKLLYFFGWCFLFLTLILNLQTGNTLEKALYSSEPCYIPFLYKDIVEYKSSFNEWTFQPAPSIFPEMICYFLLQSIFNDFRISILLYLLLQLIAFIYGWGKLADLFCDDDDSKYKAKTIIVFLTAIAVFPILPSSCSFISSLFFSTTDHFALMMILPYNLFFVFQCFLKNNFSGFHIKLFALCVINFLMVLSDLLYFVEILVPILVILAIISIHTQKNKRKIWNVILLFLTAAILGYIAFKAYIPSSLFRSYIEFAPFKKIKTLNLVLTKCLDVLNKEGLCVIAIGVIAQVVFVIYTIKQKKTPSPLYYFTLFCLVSFLTTVLGCIIIAGNAGIRYLLVSLLGPFIWLIYLILPHLNKNKYEILLWLLLFSGIVFELYIYPLKPAALMENTLKTPYPVWLQKLDVYCKNHNLKEGLADYWHARYIDIFSKEKLRMGQICPGGEPFTDIYNKNACRKINPSFVLIAKNFGASWNINLSAITNLFGTPEEFVRLDPERNILNYASKSNIIGNYYRDRSFVGIDDIAKRGFHFKGYALPGADNTITGKSRSCTSGASRCLTSGPYLELPEGKYQFNFTYTALSTNENDIVGKYDVFYWYNNGKEYVPGKVLTNGILPCTQTEVCDQFEITKEMANYQKPIMEVRSFYCGRGVLTIHELHIKKIK
jgi:hypothetical protein